MKRDRSKLTDDSIRKCHYNTRSSSCHGISYTDRDETSDAIVESPSASSSSLRVTRLRKKFSDDRRTNSDQLPIDVTMEILKLLQPETLARFLCVSKLWASIIRGRDFMKLFLNESLSRPSRLFFGFKRGDGCSLFSLLQTQDPDEASVATFHMKYPLYKITTYSSSVHGLICYASSSASGVLVYNFTTRKSITLPEFDSQSFVIKPLLGYDPIDGVYKVLCMTGPRLEAINMPKLKRVLQVLTLGSDENSWKTIEHFHNHYPASSQIFLNGVLYYGALDYTHDGMNLNETVVMSFDVRFEQLGLIKIPGDSHYVFDRNPTMMIKYEGKLAIASNEIPANGTMVLWVLEDALKHEWLKKIFVLPSSWRIVVAHRSLTLPRFQSVANAGGFILAPIHLRKPPFYVFYYDPETITVRKVEIKGITEHDDRLRWKKRQPCYLSYFFSSEVESLMFL